MVRVDLLTEPLDAPAEFAQFQRAAEHSGAIASFTGCVRAAGSDDAPLDALVLHHHPVATLASMEAIGADAAARFALNHARIVHRSGTMRPGDAIVFVAAAAPHRRAALDAVDYMMDRLKTEAVFWKSEESADGRRWIEPRANDHADRARWDDRHAANG